jgi:hypothetical protein|tara:strand:+ start:140 stop:2044 length:1905 start_codon:yes stop_codon:yes gene_type:complete
MAEYEWAQLTLGQNEKIAEVAQAAGKASALLDANLAFVKTSFELGKILFLATVNPQLALLVVIANEIDKFINDLKGTGFYILEVTPTGMEVLPSDAEGNPIELLFSPITLAASYTAAAAAGLTAEFTTWSTKFLGLPNPSAGAFTKSQYSIIQGKSLDDEVSAERVTNDIVTTRDAIFGLEKMSATQVIASMVAAMDDQADERRPQFSDSADVAALIVVIGFSDLTKNMVSLEEILKLFVGFFGGENGLLTKGLKGILDKVSEAVASLDNTESFQSTIKLKDVCGVRGTKDDRKVLRQLIPQSQWDAFASDSSAYYYNYPALFEVGDLVVGPFAGFNGRAIGYVSKTTIPDPNDSTKQVESASQTEDDEKEGTPYFSQTLTINCLSEKDQFAFDTFGNGNVIQKVAYFKNQSKHIDQNSGEFILGPERNDYKYMKDLTEAEAASVAKVKRVKGKVILEEYSPSSVLETHGQTGPGGEGFKTKNHVQGEIGQSMAAVKKQAPPPNFKAAKLEDLLDDLKVFFFQIQQFTNGMRAFAAEAIAAIDEATKFLEDKIEELEDLNDAIQSILKIFTTGIPDSGVYWLIVPSTTGGNNAIKNALSEATGGPPNSLDYSVGFMMMGGAAAIDPLAALIGGG